MSQNYKRKLIRRVTRMLLRSKSPLLDAIVSPILHDDEVDEYIEMGGIPIRDLLVSIIESEL